MSHPYRTLETRTAKVISERLGLGVAEVDALAKELRDTALVGLDPTSSRRDLGQLTSRLFDVHSRHQHLAVRARWMFGGAATFASALAFLTLNKAAGTTGTIGLLAPMVLLGAVVMSVPLIAWIESYLAALQRLHAALLSFERAVGTLPVDGHSTGVRVAPSVTAVGDVAREVTEVSESRAKKESER